MPSKRDLKNVSADTHLRERVQKQASRTAWRVYFKHEKGATPFFYVRNYVMIFLSVHRSWRGRLPLLKRTLIGLLRSHELTGDKAKDPMLKSHFYKLSRERSWEEVVSTLKKMQGYKVLHEVQSVGEIVLEKKTMSGRTMDITVSVISVNPVTAAVDIYSASRGSFGDLGSNYRVIIDIYRTLDKKLAQYKTSGV
jgi:hypothetical protein